MTGERTPRTFILRHDGLVAGLILMVWTLTVVASYWGTWSIDMSALYMAGRFAASGQDALIYAAPPDFFSRTVPDAWQTELASFGQADEFAVPFVYPPVWAWAMAPFAYATDPIAFFDATRVLMLAAFAGSVVMAWRLMRPEGVPLTAFAVVSVIVASLTIPFQFSASLNQPQFLLVFLILWSFERYLTGRPVTAGILLGLVAAVKVSPILLALIFAADRNWRAVFATLGMAGAVACLSLAVAGIGLHLTFLERVAQIEGLLPLIGFNMTFETAMHDFFVPLKEHPFSINQALFVDTPWVSLLSKALLVATTAGALWITRELDRAARIRLRLILVYLSTVWFSPLAWMHYYTLPLLLAPGLVGIWPLRKTAVVTLLLAAGFSEPVMMTWFDYTLDHGIYTLFFAQHTGLFPLILFAALVAKTAPRPRNEIGGAGLHDDPRGPGRRASAAAR